jgi:hypothetical protein
MDNKNIKEKDILRYLDLVDRRLQILLHSGVQWKPEYAKEMEDIDREIPQLREKLGMDPVREEENHEE